MSSHCESDECRDKDKFGYCCCKCAPCVARKDIEGDWAENECKARREEQIGND